MGWSLVGLVSGPRLALVCVTQQEDDRPQAHHHRREDPHLQHGVGEIGRARKLLGLGAHHNQTSDGGNHSNDEERLADQYLLVDHCPDRMDELGEDEYQQQPVEQGEDQGSERTLGDVAEELVDDVPEESHPGKRERDRNADVEEIFDQAERLLGAFAEGILSSSSLRILHTCTLSRAWAKRPDSGPSSHRSSRGNGPARVTEARECCRLRRLRFTGRTFTLGMSLGGNSVGASILLKRLLATCALLLGTLSVIPNAGARVDPPTARPNILVIVTDDQRTGLEVMPATRDWFVREGRRYPNAFASTPLCCPSRASIFTGRYAHNHGLISNSPEDPHEKIDPDTWISSYLQSSGYRTGLFGKLLNGWSLEASPPGFDDWAIFRSGYYDSSWNVDGTTQTIGTYSTTYIRTQTLDFFAEAERDDDRPWLAFVTPNAPHVPPIAEAEHRRADVGQWLANPSIFEEDLSDKPRWLRDRKCNYRCGQSLRREQFRTLMSVDDMVAAFRSRLEQLEETNTLAIYMTDNGYLWGDHGLHGKGQPYTDPAKIPLYVRWPGQVAPFEKNPSLALNVDIAPTLLEAARISPGRVTPTMDGRSLLSSPPRDRILLEYWCNVKSCDRWASTRTRRYQYIERYDKTGELRFREYYDLRKDPWQLQNVLHDGRKGNSPANLVELSAQLQSDRTCVESSCP